MEQEVLQQQSPLSQAHELEAELPEQGQVAHGEQAAGRGEGVGKCGGKDGGQGEKVRGKTETEIQPECPN